ncbi:transposase [Mycobacterium heckeshornense]|uniref:transposase n=1 Tax=Mycobacterium heckeshornense TaxID=110505 RepID=UPI0039BDE0DA
MAELLGHSNVTVTATTYGHLTVEDVYSRGMTTRDIEAHLAEVYGAKVSRELISNITEVVVDEIKAWQSRPLDEVYPILYIDGLRLRIADNGVVGTKVAYLAIGVDLDGRKHALGCWIQDSEGYGTSTGSFPRIGAAA